MAAPHTGAILIILGNISKRDDCKHGTGAFHVRWQPFGTSITSQQREPHQCWRTWGCRAQKRGQVRLLWKASFTREIAGVALHILTLWPLLSSWMSPLRWYSLPWAQLSREETSIITCLSLLWSITILTGSASWMWMFQRWIDLFSKWTLLWDRTTMSTAFGMKGTIFILSLSALSNKDIMWTTHAMLNYMHNIKNKFTINIYTMCVCVCVCVCIYIYTYKTDIKDPLYSTRNYVLIITNNGKEPEIYTCI